MKLLTITALLFISVFSKSTYAGDFYVGTDLNNLQFEQTGFETTNAYALVAGYELNRWSIEGSYNFSKTNNKYFGGDQKVNMYHLYTVYRSAGSYYYKVKLGLTNERYKFSDGTGKLILNDVHTGVARGLGIGYRYGQLSFELEYNWLGGSLEMVGGGFKYKF